MSSPSRRSRGARLLGLTAALVAVDVAWLVVRPANIPAAVPFQSATGGTGLAYSAGAAWSFFAFDPRTEEGCENELFPVPGLSCPNPHHGARVADGGDR